MPFEVQHNTLADGWTNTWSYEGDDGELIPETFPTVDEAQAALDEFFEDIRHEIVAGYRKPDEGYDRTEYRIQFVTDTNHQPQT